eukprot:TRINITY_DN37489_c0_g1_i1.p1 TRINITY_DN37489_c0_g1~~TRINITY_DN37489_c0_g1_i1.p1  ORF type:complete len:236 (+),score=51.17 TRINITY_DN37489_c0_g1_i1:75-710(+)
MALLRSSLVVLAFRFVGASGASCAAGEAECSVDGEMDAMRTSLLQMQKKQRVGAVAQKNVKPTADMSEDTGGSCSILSCADSRGATVCAKRKCYCAQGWTAKLGTCVAKAGQCNAETGGSCAVLDCDSWRGETKCWGPNNGTTHVPGPKNRCVCKTGYCASAGKCYNQRHTGGSCDVFSCADSRGPTICHNGKCICKEGYFATQGGQCQKL